MLPLETAPQLQRVASPQTGSTTKGLVLIHGCDPQQCAANRPMCTADHTFSASDLQTKCIRYDDCNDVRYDRSSHDRSYAHKKHI